MVARAVYHHSQRADRPFLPVNCAAIPETLLESELFDTKKVPLPGLSPGASAGLNSARGNAVSG